MVAPNLRYLKKGSEVLTAYSWLRHRVTSGETDCKLIIYYSASSALQFHAAADQYAEAKMDLRKVVDTGKQKRGM